MPRRASWEEIKEGQRVCFMDETDNIEGTIPAMTWGIVARRGKYLVRVQLDNGRFATVTTHDSCPLSVTIEGA